MDLKDAQVGDVLQHVANTACYFEVQPTQAVGDDRHVCYEAEATQWSVYKRPRSADANGQRLAEWVADCIDNATANALAEVLQAEQDEKE